MLANVLEHSGSTEVTASFELANAEPMSTLKALYIFTRACEHVLPEMPFGGIYFDFRAFWKTSGPKAYR